MRYVMMALMVLQFWAGPVFAQNDHGLPSADQEQRARDFPRPDRYRRAARGGGHRRPLRAQERGGE